MTTANPNTLSPNNRAIYDEQAAYYRLCTEARKLGIPTSLDDPRSPRTVAGLRDAVLMGSAR